MTSLSAMHEDHSRLRICDELCSTTGRYSSMCLRHTCSSIIRRNTMARELITPEGNVTTEDLLDRPVQPDTTTKAQIADSHLALFPNPDSEDLRRRWNEIQASFVDEPKPSVEKADELVASVIQKVTQVF